MLLQRLAFQLNIPVQVLTTFALAADRIPTLPNGFFRVERSGLRQSPP
jgi:hypothetical protein